MNSSQPSNERQFSQNTQSNLKSQNQNQSEEVSEVSTEKKMISQSQKDLQSQSQIGSNKMISQNQITSQRAGSQIYNEQQTITQEDINQLKKIFAQFRQFKPDRQNKIQLLNPSLRIIMQIIGIWKKRSFKAINYILTLVLDDLSEQLIKEKSKLIQFFEPLPSIKLILEGEQVQNKKATHLLQGGNYYEGIDNQYMMISKSNGQKVDYYQGQVKDMVQNGQGTIHHFDNGKPQWQYTGQFVDGKRQGLGKQMSSKGVSYEGEFKNDYKHGKGMQIVMKKRKHPQPNQDVYIQKNKYVGYFELGHKQGHGVQITAHGQYEGQWHQGVKQGKGKITYKNGHTYQGQWINNLFNGQGDYIQVVFINGQQKQNKYSGQFKDGYYHGKGVMEYGNGDKYDGQWALGKKEGEGMYQWADGDYYDGHWEKDSAQGTGAACFGGVFYDGQFHLGEKHGLGQQTDADGNTVKAMWQHNKILKKLQENGQILDQQDEQN